MEKREEIFDGLASPRRIFECIAETDSIRNNDKMVKTQIKFRICRYFIK